jgi:hypothetical protein
MAIKKQVFVMAVVFNEEETHAESAVEAISHRLFNEDGIIEWDFKITKEETLSADVTDEDIEKSYKPLI